MSKNKKSLAELLTDLQGALKGEEHKDVLVIVNGAVVALNNLAEENALALANLEAKLAVAEAASQAALEAKAELETKLAEAQSSLTASGDVEQLKAELDAMIQANKELAEKLDLLSENSASGIATVSIGKKLYRAKNKRWLCPGKGYVTIANCEDQEVFKHAIEKGILVALNEKEA